MNKSVFKILIQKKNAKNEQSEAQTSKHNQIIIRLNLYVLAITNRRKF